MDTNKVLIFASLWHSGQVRKYTDEPYFEHPKRVAEWARTYDADDDIYHAALCHDLLEDTAVSTDMIMHVIGVRATHFVVELTDVFTHEAFPNINRKIRKRSEACRLSQVSPEAKLIKVADIADNTASIVANDPKFAVVYLAEKAYLMEELGVRNDGRDLLTQLGFYK